MKPKTTNEPVQALDEKTMRKPEIQEADATFKKGFLRLKDVLKIVPVSRSVWYDGIRRGEYPKSIKLSKRTSAWRVSDIDALCDYLGGEV